MTRPNTIIVYSVQHAGRDFVFNLLNQSEGTSWNKKKPSIHAALKEPKVPNKVLDDEWLDTVVLPYIHDDGIDELPDKLLLAVHIGSPQESLCRAAKSKKQSAVKIVVPLRDPLLSVWTELHRGSGLWHWTDSSYKTPRASKTNSREARLAERSFRKEIIKNRIACFTALLQIPEHTSFVVPVDLLAKKDSATKIDCARQLFEFCNLIPTTQASELAANWTPVNHTRIKDVIFNQIKDAIINKNIDKIREYLDIEFDALQRCRTLKRQLSSLGYDLSWF